MQESRQPLLHSLLIVEGAAQQRRLEILVGHALDDVRCTRVHVGYAAGFRGVRITLDPDHQAVDQGVHLVQRFLLHFVALREDTHLYGQTATRYSVHVSENVLAFI